MNKIKLIFALIISFLLFDMSISQDIEVIKKGSVTYEVERVREIVKNTDIHIPEKSFLVHVEKGWHYDNVAKFWTNGNFVKTSEEMMRDGKAFRIVKHDASKGYYHIYNTQTKEIRIYLIGFSDNHKKTIYRIKGTSKSGAKVYDSVKRINDAKARAEFNRARAGFRPVVTTLPTGASMNVGPVVVSQDRRYVRLSVNPWFSSIKSVKTFTFRR